MLKLLRRCLIWYNYQCITEFILTNSSSAVTFARCKTPLESQSIKNRRSTPGTNDGIAFSARFQKNNMPRDTPQSKENNESQKNRHGNPEGNVSNENVKAAHDQAESDIEQDADLSIHSPNDDLDEGETARLGEDKNDLA